MSETLKFQTASGPQGKFDVSTVRTDAGGAPPNKPWDSPFSSSDFADETPWPYETMVFRGGSTGFYHRAYASKAEALAGHAETVALILEGKLSIGHGVRGPFGVPSLTPDEWRTSQAGATPEAPDAPKGKEG